jgi:hypothetical protein
VHFFGAADFSFGHNISLIDGDRMEVQWDGFGKALRNPIKIGTQVEPMIKVTKL